MDYNKKYACAICGKEYETIEERTACETTCLQKLKEEQQKQKDAKLKADEQARKEEIDKKYKELDELINKFIDDYGYFNHCVEYNNHPKTHNLCSLLNDMKWWL